MKAFLAALAATLVTAGAAAASDTYRIPYGDLDLSAARGAAAFDQRVAATARRVCRGEVGLQARQCAARLRDATVQGLSASARADYARSRQSVVV